MSAALAAAACIVLTVWLGCRDKDGGHLFVVASSTQQPSAVAADTTAVPIAASATRYQCTHKCGFTESFQAVAAHEKTCSKRVQAVEAGVHASGRGASATRAGLASTAADSAVRSAPAAADSDRASHPAQLEPGQYVFVGKSAPILREGTLPCMLPQRLPSCCACGLSGGAGVGRRGGACVRTGEALDSPELTLREPITPGSYVNVVEVHGRRGRIDSPSCGWLSLM